MNIFVNHQDSKFAAQQNCAVHTVSQVKEISQMLTYCFDAELLNYAPLTKSGTVRKQGKSHRNHPCSKFIRQSKSNMYWALEHAYYLDEERLWRANNTKQPHWDIQFFDWVVNNIDNSLVPDGPLTEFAVAIGDDKICRQRIKDFDKLPVVEQYHQYYICDKTFAEFGRRGAPSWFTELKQKYRLC